MLKTFRMRSSTKVLIPISHVVLTPAQQRELPSIRFSTHTHARADARMGPHNDRSNVFPRILRTVRLQLKELYSSIEEARGGRDWTLACSICSTKRLSTTDAANAIHTYLASMVSLGALAVTESHARGVAMQSIIHG